MILHLLVAHINDIFLDTQISLTKNEKELQKDERNETKFPKQNSADFFMSYRRASES